MKPQVHFRTPRRDEMQLRQGWLSDPQVMSYNARWNVEYPGYHRETGCVDFPPEDWDGWYDAWVDQPDRKYWFVEDDQGRLVEHAHFSVKQDENGRRVASIGATVFPEFRKTGVGEAVFTELVRRLRERGDVVVVQNNFEATRAAAVRIHEALKFRVVETDSSSDPQRPVNLYELKLLNP